MRYRWFSEQEHTSNYNVSNLLDGIISSEPCTETLVDFVSEPVEECLAPCDEPAVALASVVVAAPAAAAATSAAEPVNNTEEPGSADTIRNSTILEILGEDPTISNNFGAEIHKDLAVRLEHTAIHGLSKEQRKEITEKYLLPSNCKLINAPVLNAEIKAAISDINAKRDKNIEIRQKQVSTAISCLSQAINSLISKSDNDPELIRMLMDTERILCDLQYHDSTIRRNFILSSLKKDMKDQLQNTKPDLYLFGENLSEAIKTAKAINKSGAELKTPLPKPPMNKKAPAPTPSTSRANLNWKGPYPTRKQLTRPKTKEPPPRRGRPSNSSRPSQQPPPRDRR